MVLHVVDHQHVADEEWAGAQKAASDAYARIGVRLLWTSGSARLATADHRVHLDVAVLDEGLQRGRRVRAERIRKSESCDGTRDDLLPAHPRACRGDRQPRAAAPGAWCSRMNLAICYCRRAPTRRSG